MSTIARFRLRRRKTPMSTETDIEQRASEWVIRSEREPFTAEMRLELENWLRSPRNRIAFVRIRTAWRWADRLRTTRPGGGDVDPDILADRKVSARS